MPEENMDKKVPKNGCDAFYENFDLSDNPFPEWELQFEHWDQEFMEAAKNYKEEGRFHDNTFKG